MDSAGAEKLLNRSRKVFICSDTNLVLTAAKTSAFITRDLGKINVIKHFHEEIRLPLDF